MPAGAAHAKTRGRRTDPCTLWKGGAPLGPQKERPVVELDGQGGPVKHLEGAVLSSHGHERPAAVEGQALVVPSMQTAHPPLELPCPQ